MLDGTKQRMTACQQLAASSGDSDGVCASPDPGPLLRSPLRGCQRTAGRSRCTTPDAPATLFVDLDVHPRIVMQTLRHAEFDVTVEVYASSSSAATREALKRLGESRWLRALRYFAAVSADSDSK